MPNAEVHLLACPLTFMVVTAKGYRWNTQSPGNHGQMICVSDNEVRRSNRP